MKHLHLTRLLAFALALTLLLGCAACGKDDADDTGETVGKKDAQTAAQLQCVRRHEPVQNTKYR